jgi:hypothetical protein
MLAGPFCSPKCATALALVPSAAISHTSRKFEPLSVIPKYSSLNPAGLTALAEPPLFVVGTRKSCEVMAPLDERANAET